MPASQTYISMVEDELVDLDIPLETATQICSKYINLIEDAEHAGRRAASVADELKEYKGDADTSEKVTKYVKEQNAENLRLKEELSPYRILHGHESINTAIAIDDYPFGYKLRCIQRHWIEVAEKGSQKGKYRHVMQTTERKWNYRYTDLLHEAEKEFPDDPYKSPVFHEYRKTAIWNKPKGSTYYYFMFLYSDPAQYIQSAAIELYSGPDKWTKFRNMWQINTPQCQFTAEQLKLLWMMEQASRKSGNPQAWREWEEEHGVVPEIITELIKKE